MMTFALKNHIANIEFSYLFQKFLVIAASFPTRAVTHRLYVVAIRIQDKCPIVIGVVVRAKTRSAIIFPACRNGSFEEGVNLGAIANAKSNMDRRIVWR
jgi:hypothetical protein